MFIKENFPKLGSFQRLCSNLINSLKFSKYNLKNVIFFCSLFVLFFSSSFNLPLSVEAFTPQTKNQINRDQKRKYKEWLQLLKYFPPEDGAIKLKQKFSFPKTKVKKDQVFLYQPRYFCSDRIGNIFVSDSGNHNIVKFDSQGNYLNEIGKQGQAPGEFLMPRFIDTDSQNNLIVYDTGNSRIQIFNSKDRYRDSFKIFKTYDTMAADKDGLIYLSPSTSNIHDPLIEVLNQKGKLIKSFGKRIEFKHNSDVHNKIAIISINNKGNIFAAWNYFPIVRRYSKDGELLSEFFIKHKLIKKFARPNYKAKLVNYVITMKSVIADIDAKENKFYLFIKYPRIEVLELNLRGELNKIYWKDTSYKFIANDFFIKENNKHMEFLYVLNILENQEIKVFSQ